ncbi:unnamed protein product, partial [Mesorhabditis spiculigera]
MTMYSRRPRPYSIDDNMMHNRRGVVYNLNEAGIARIIMDKENSTFQGILETRGGEVFSLRGQINPADGLKKGNEGQLMEIYLVDGEAGTSFQLDKVPVLADGQHLNIQHTAINFVSKERLVGVRALQEVQQFFNPESLTQAGMEVYVGPMQVQLMASKRTRAPSRRESLSTDASVTILELSDDFLA